MRSALRFDMPDLRLFVAIVDAGSITKGAEAANLALASASERLRNIESEAGVALLRRRARGVATTEAGEAFAHHARKILQQQSLLRRELDDFAAGARGTLRLYANTAALTEYLPGRLAEWLAERPRVALELKERTSIDIVRLVHAGMAEAGIVSDSLDSMQLQMHRLARDQLVVVCSKDSPIAGRASVSFQRALDEPFVGLAGDNAQQALIAGYAQAAGRKLEPRVRMHTHEGMCQMVSRGIGIGVLSLNTADKYRAQHSLDVVPLGDAWASRWLCACFRSWDELSAPMRSLLTHLQRDEAGPS